MFSRTYVITHQPWYFRTLDSDFWTDLNFIENSRLGTRTGSTKKQKTANRVLRPVSVILDRLNSFQR